MRNPTVILSIAAMLVGTGVATPPEVLAQSSPRAPVKKPDIIKPTLEADKLVKIGKFDDATKKFETIWNDLRKQDAMLSGGNAPFICENIRNLCKRHASARDRFRTMRDQTADSFETRGKQLTDLAAWIVLNRIVDQEDRTLDWWEKVRVNPVAKDVLVRFRPWLEPLLDRNGRTGDLAVMIDDPAALVRREFAGFRSAVRRESSELNYRVSREVFLTRHAKHYTSLLLSGRERDATRLATEAMTVDHSPEMVMCMVKAALDCGRPAQQHLDWLTAVSARGNETLQTLKRRVEDELAKAPTTPTRPEPTNSPGRRPATITTAAAQPLPSIVPTDTQVER